MNNYIKYAILPVALLVLFAAWVIDAYGPPPVEGNNATRVGGDQREAVEAIVHDYLMENPTVIMEALQNAQEADRRQQMEAQRKNVEKYHDEIYATENVGFGGNPDADAVIVEFFDYNCGACKFMFQGLDELIQKDDNVKVLFREFPIFGPTSDENARIGLAVADMAPGKYYAFHKAMMTKEGNADAEFAYATAGDLGIDVDALRELAESEEIQGRMESERELANNIGLRGTPALIIGDEVQPGAISYDELQPKVDALR
ncbi:MAG: hypothetical protein CMM94_08645 [Rickettsiales bacterium]|nr:hypothetical protein [Rickettsiales bacterium]